MSSFTDFWRRINIYWKDFMMKVFYYPAFFRLRRLGDYASACARDGIYLPDDVVPAFRPSGSGSAEPPESKANDVIFWTVLALLELVNSL